MILFRWVWCVCVGLLLTGCAQTAVATPEPVTITIGGATAMQPLLQALTATYSNQHPAVRFDLRGGGSTVGEERVRAGQLDLAASTLTPATPLTATSNLLFVPIGLDGLALIVHPTNPLTTVTQAQVRDLFSGRIFDWSELSSTSGEVLLVSREDGSGSRILFETRIMGEEQVSLTAVVMPTSADVVAFVAKNPPAIGYVSRAYVLPALAFTPETITPPDVRVLALDGLLPTVETVKTQRYPLTQPLFLVSRGEPQGPVRAFIDFALSPAGQTIVERFHARVR
jgi:phosphate transport system substrate-binding protein